MKVLVTGGAGFIGSHLAKRLLDDGNEVVVIDNLSNGSRENLTSMEGNVNFTFYEFDVNNTIKLKNVFDNHPFDMVFHLAANADVSRGEESTQVDFENTLQTTLNVLEMMRIYEIKKFFFASSSTVYGNAEERLQEHRSIMRPISHYGAAKMASEAFISSYSHLHDFQVWIARFSNAVGPNMLHGVIPDLIKKLRVHPDFLEVYGDGTQLKPYIYIDDLVEAVMTMLEKTDEHYNAYLVGVDSALTVDQIVALVMDEMDIHAPVQYGGRYTGWKGDVRKYQYDVSRLRLMGWTPKYNAEQAVRKAIRENM